MVAAGEKNDRRGIVGIADIKMIKKAQKTGGVFCA